VTYTRAEVNRRIKAVAARLQQVGEPGDRVALLMGNSPEYLFGFLGAQYACQVAMPLYGPTEPGHGDHLNAVLEAAPPNVVLTNKRSAAAVRSIFAAKPPPSAPACSPSTRCRTRWPTTSCRPPRTPSTPRSWK